MNSLLIGRHCIPVFSPYTVRQQHVTSQLTSQWLNSFCFNGWFCISFIMGRDYYFLFQRLLDLRKSTFCQGDTMLTGTNEPYASCSYIPDSLRRHWQGCWIPIVPRDNEENCVEGSFSKLKSWIQCWCNIFETVKIRHMYIFRQTFKWQHKTAASAIDWVCGFYNHKNSEDASWIKHWLSSVRHPSTYPTTHGVTVSCVYRF